MLNKNFIFGIKGLNYHTFYLTYACCISVHVNSPPNFPAIRYYETERFTLPPMHLIKLYLSRDEDGWDCHHLQKQTQKLIGGNYAG